MHNLAPLPSLMASPTPLPLAYFLLSTLVSLLFPKNQVCSHLRTFALALPTAWNGSFLDILKTHNTTSFKSLLQCHFLRIIPATPLPTLQISFLCPLSSFVYNIYRLLTCCVVYILINEGRGLPCIGFIPSA